MQTDKKPEELKLLPFLPSLSLLPCPCQLASAGNSITETWRSKLVSRKVTLAASRMAPGSAGDQIAEEQLR